MQRLHIIGGPEAGGIEELLDFIRGALEEVAEITYCRLDQVAHVVKGGRSQMIDAVQGQELSGYDLVWFRGRLAAHIKEACMVAQYLEKHDTPSVNSFYRRRPGVGKINQMHLLTEHHIPAPDTVTVSNDKLPEYIRENLSYPVVVKDIVGSHGNHNYLVHNDAELDQVLQSNPEIRFMAQQYIAADGDYRILVAGNDQLIIHRKGSDGTHLNNTSQGAASALIDPADFPQHILVQARQFAALCDYEIAGVDVIIDNTSGQHYFLEINSQPQLADGAFVSDKQQLMGRYFTNLLQELAAGTAEQP